MKRAKVGVADGELPVGMGLRFEQQAMTGTIHRLQAVRLVLARLPICVSSSSPTAYLVHIIFVVLPMAGYLPERTFVDRRGQDFAETVLKVLCAEEGDEFVDDMGTIGEKER